MLERLDFWLAVFTLGALAYWELRLGRFIGPIVRGVIGVAETATDEVKRRRQRRMPTVRLQSRPVRTDDGRFNGSLPASVGVTSGVTSVVTPVQPSLQGVAASGRGVADGNDVAGVTVSPEEMMLISLRLGQGLSPSAVVKSLPGYSPRKNYDLYKAKVEQVQAALAQLEPADQPQETLST